MLVRILFTLGLAVLFIATASAHSPDNVRRDAKKAQCESFLKTPAEKVDASDPVTRAIMKKCGVERPDKANNDHDAAEQKGEHHH